MDSELQDIEDTLKAFRPVMPEPACMERLLAAVEGRAQVTESGLRSVEERLLSMSPVPMTANVEAALLSTVSRVAFPVDDKVVLFPGNSKSGEIARSRRPWFAAAAAVAVAGAFSAMMVSPPETGDFRSNAIAGGNVSKANAPRGFVPASVGSGVEEARDEGVMWTPAGEPMRMVRVIYADKVKYLNERGEVIEVERPRVEYFMVPEKID